MKKNVMAILGDVRERVKNMFYLFVYLNSYWLLPFFLLDHNPSNPGAKPCINGILMGL